MKKIINEFGKICKMDQPKLKKYLCGKLENAGYNVINEDGFLYAKGEIPILLTAHMDTVHKVTCRKYRIVKTKIGGKIAVTSDDGIGGDDRCGIWIITHLIDKGYRPSILFCEDEEIGGVGSNKFCKSEYIEDLRQLNYFIELDRANADDAVFYDCGNEEFQKFIMDNTGYKDAYGSFSDISHLSPVCDIASVNLSCGYYDAHTKNEYVVISEMEKTAAITEKLLLTESKQFDYQEVSHYFGRGYGYGYGYGYYGNRGDILEGIEIIYLDKDGIEINEIVWGNTIQFCFGDFFINHPDLCMKNVYDYEEIYW